MSARAQEHSMTSKEKQEDATPEIAGTHDHQGIVAECAGYPYVELSELVGVPGVVVVLDEITDPRNVGAIARSAEATGAIGLVNPRYPTIDGMPCVARVADLAARPR